MNERPAFSRATAYHEAGHAMAYVYYGRGIELCEVYGNQNLGPGPRPRRGGTMPKRLPFPGKVHEELVCTYAGPIAHARYQRTTLEKVFDRGGWCDALNIDEVLTDNVPEEPWDERPRRAERAEQEARLLIRLHWLWVVEIAEKLARVGRIKGDDIVLRRR